MSGERILIYPRVLSLFSHSRPISPPLTGIDQCVHEVQDPCDRDREGGVEAEGTG